MGKCVTEDDLKRFLEEMRKSKSKYFCVVCETVNDDHDVCYCDCDD